MLPDYTTAIICTLGHANLENRIKGLDERTRDDQCNDRRPRQNWMRPFWLRTRWHLHRRDETRQKGEEIDKAQKEFDKIANKYANTRVGHLASVWSWQCSFVNGDGAKAIPAIEKFVASNKANRDAADAVRLGSYFGIEHVYSAEPGKADNNPAGPFIRTELAAQNWLKMYPEAKNTSEGLGARFRRGLMKEKQAFLPGGVIFETPPKAKTPAPMPKARNLPRIPREKSRKGERSSAGSFEDHGISPGPSSFWKTRTRFTRNLRHGQRVQRSCSSSRLSLQLVILEAKAKVRIRPSSPSTRLSRAYLAAQVQQAKMFDEAKDATKKPEELDAG